MPISDTTYTTLCESCALFGADYTEEFNVWWNSREPKYRFEIPFHQTDTLPELPNLTKSADAGCGLCAAIKKGVRAQVENFRQRDERGGGGGGIWGSRKRQAGSADVEEGNSKKEAEQVELELTGGFEFSSGGIPTVNIPPALAIFISTKHTVQGRGGYTASIEFEVSGSSTDPRITSPPLISLPCETTLCPQNIKLIHRWLTDCELNHTGCKKGQRGKFLPTRLICVRPGGIRLVESYNLTDEEKRSIRYIALSHCWGPETDVPYKTTSSNLQERISGIATETLPCNIRDAITVTQALSTDYLWIDSICIIQNLPQDLENEMLVMLEVYSNSYLTISATGASGVQEGFLERTGKSGPTLTIPRRDTSQRPYSSNEMTIFTESGGFVLHWIWGTQVGDSPWNTRAWTLQESLVAPRILHITKERLFFECSEIDCFEGGDMSRPPQTGHSNSYSVDQVYRSANFLRQQAFLNYTDNDIDSAKIAQLYKDYYSVVRKYSNRKLTFMHDKAAAFSSIIIAITRITGTSARHGLLMNDIRRGLLWSGYGKKRLEAWPTWSWLSIDGEVFFPSDCASSPADEVAMMRLLVDATPSRSAKIEGLLWTDGSTIDKQLRLYGLLIQATVEKSKNHVEFLIMVDNTAVGNAEFDDESEFVPSMNVYLLSFGESAGEKRGGRGELDHKKCAFRGLMLLHHDEKTFKRIGLFHLYSGMTSISENKDSRWVFKGVSRTAVAII